MNCCTKFKVCVITNIDLSLSSAPLIYLVDTIRHTDILLNKYMEII